MIGQDWARGGSDWTAIRKGRGGVYGGVEGGIRDGEGERKKDVEVSGSTSKITTNECKQQKVSLPVMV